MIAINAHFDGKVIVPDEPVDLPRNQALVVRIEALPADGPHEDGSVLTWLAEHASDSPMLPADLSDQHDHYLYGLALGWGRPPGRGALWAPASVPA